MQTVQHFCASNADSTALLRLRTTKVLYCMLIVRLKCRQYSTFAPSDDKSAVLYANFAPEMQTVQHFCASKPPPEPSETPGYCRGTKIDAFPIFWKLGNFLRPINASSASMKEAKAKGHLPYWIALRLLPCLVQLGSDLVPLRSIYTNSRSTASRLLLVVGSTGTSRHKQPRVV